LTEINAQRTFPNEAGCRKAAVMTDPASIRRLYGRRTGHKLRLGQAALVEDLLPGLAVPAAGALTAHTLYGDDRPLWLEIGFGRGEHMAAQAEANPHIGIIGAEPFLDGVVGALMEVRDRGLSNVRLHNGDALDVIDRLPDASLDRLFLLHPDPWPKARHAKRRFVNPTLLPLVARALRPSGEWRIASDDPTHQAWVAEVMAGQALFEVPPPAATRPDGWPPTRYEAKALREGRRPLYWNLVRR
jgi:tRNA (guanine-N7-)-methyltransferase